MEKTETYVFPDSFILPHYALIAMLKVLLDKTELTNAVKKHCKTGLKIVGIISANTNYNTGTHLLLKEEFNAFFKSFPAIHFNNRELIPPTMIIENIEQCIKANKVLCVDN